jgi:very-short-patch-repair endonuclease
MGAVTGDGFHTGNEPGCACARLARSQRGLLTARQGTQFGLSKRAIQRRVASGAWEKVLPGVYRLPGAAASWEQRLIAAWLWAGQGAAVSHRTAAVLLGLDGFDSGPVEISTTRPVHGRAAGVIVHRVRRLDRADVMTLGGICLTQPARTLLDLGAVAPAALVERAMEDALRRGLVSLSRLRWTLERVGGPGRPGTAVLRMLVEERAPSAPAESPLEVDVIRLLRRAGLPEPVRQHEVRVGGHVVAIVDLAYVDERIAIECDGYRYHSGRAAWQRDRERLNDLTDLGWRVIHATIVDVREAQEAFAARVRRGLSAERREASQDAQTSERPGQAV